MSACDECPIEQKLLLCCGRYPLTGDQSGAARTAGANAAPCPHLSPQGLCGIYHGRPQACREFYCEAYASNSLLYDNTRR